MTDIIIYGLQRSGNHYFINWLLNNLSGNNFDKFKYFKWGKYGWGKTYKKDIIFINNDGYIFEEEDGNGKKKKNYYPEFKYNIISIENPDINIFYPYLIKNRDSKRKLINIILLRDVLNTLASHFKRKPALEFVPDVYLQKYLSLCKEIVNKENKLDNKLFVSYNKHVKDKRYRNAIAAKFSTPNYDMISKLSNHSSFQYKGDYNLRYKKIKFPKESKKIILNPEIIKYTKELFDMDIKI